MARRRSRPSCATVLSCLAPALLPCPVPSVLPHPASTICPYPVPTVLPCPLSTVSSRPVRRAFAAAPSRSRRRVGGMDHENEPSETNGACLQSWGGSLSARSPTTSMHGGAGPLAGRWVWGGFVSRRLVRKVECMISVRQSQNFAPGGTNGREQENSTCRT